jgi:predicted permease
MFDFFGQRPTVGRLLGAKDDLRVGENPYAVLSYDYWRRRFGRDPGVIGRTFRMGNEIFQIAGVAAERFTGTEPGRMTDVFVPITMKDSRTLAGLNRFWMRTLLQLRPEVPSGPMQERLRATFRVLQEERAQGFPAQSRRDRERFFEERLRLEPAASGRSNLQREYRQALAAFGVLVALVLLIACANVANLMTAQAAARAREMALRVSIGAGRWRLVQLVLVESAWSAFLAAAAGAVFTWWSAPLIVGMINPAAYPVRLVLPADWRVLGFGLALASGVTLLFGLTPALRASAVKPAGALRGGEDPYSRRRLMHALIAAQVAFCVVVHFAAALLVSSFARLAYQPTGFSAERILNLEAVTERPQAPALWEQVATHLRSAPGVERVAITGWPLLSGEHATGNISINGAPPTDVFSDFVIASPGWIDEMEIPFMGGRDFRATDANPKVAIVNEAFAKQYFAGEYPVGKWFERVEPAGGRARLEVVGFVRDARSREDMRLLVRPTAYIPFQSIDGKGVMQAMGRGTFVVRTSSADPLALAAALRKEVARARPGYRVSSASTQVELNQSSTVRERLLAVLALFFAVVAQLLAGIGLYGVMDYGVLQRRREIGIRIAIGAQAGDIARRVTADVFRMVLIGVAAGLASGATLVRYIEALLYGVRPTGLPMLAIPAVTILAAGLVAAIPAVTRAVRIDPVTMLRAD